MAIPLALCHAAPYNHDVAHVTSRPGLKKSGMPGRHIATSRRKAASARERFGGHLYEVKEVKMPKMKTKSGAKKRFRLTASGKVRGSAAFLSHNLRRRSQKMKRKARGTMILCDADARIVKKFLPYA